MIGVGHPALAWLTRAKLVGALRKQKRRLKTLKGALLGVLGLGVVGLWLAPFLVSRFSDVARSDPASQRSVELALMLMAVLSLSSSLSFRGLYVPPGEIERLFSAPLSRSDLIRHRLLAALGKSLLGALLLGAFAARHAVVPWFGFVGGFIATLSLPILSQGASLLTGDAESRLASRIAKFPRAWLNLALTMLLAVGVASVFVQSRGLDRAFAKASRGIELERWLAHPIATALLAPVRPWARMITAADGATFALWTTVSVLAGLAGFELVARIRVDFRELSLGTAADIAKRLQRARRGLGAAGTLVANTSAKGVRGVPWIAGRGPLRALAWRKCASMLRKSRTALLIGCIVAAVVTGMSLAIARDKEHAALVGSLLVVGLGAPYLCGALRFDFREDLDQMGVIKSWPIQPWRMFAATLVPEVALVSLLLVASLFARALISGEAPPLPWLWPAVVPLVVAAWIAIDNAAFLVAPFRAVPGQEGMLQNAGRAMLLILARMLAFGSLLVLVAVPVGIAGAFAEELGLAEHHLIAIGGAAALAVLVPALALLVWIGGALLRRFDVARDRA